ncbi:calnexin-like [Stegastes partitus]|uniref:Calnexin-like n=1 Tax=Stegastes partitus TaxID=144197 RepID=A0A9Y4N894_9TELE|nr:PREDICTED: calnexin-like [Stegastes partitus]
MESSVVLLCMMLGVGVTSVSAEPGIIESFVISINQRPWLISVYVLTIGLPVILFISFMWPDKRFGPPDQPYYYKKSDDAQPDDPEMSRLSDSTNITRQPRRGDAPPIHKRKHKAACPMNN